jgi:hypothetical protein
MADEGILDFALPSRRCKSVHVRTMARETFVVVLQYIYRGYTDVLVFDSPVHYRRLLQLAKGVQLHELVAHLEKRHCIPGSIFLDMHMVLIFLGV